MHGRGGEGYRELRFSLVSIVQEEESGRPGKQCRRNNTYNACARLSKRNAWVIRFYSSFDIGITCAIATARSRREHFRTPGPALANASSCSDVRPTCGRPAKTATVAGTAPLSRMISSTPLRDGREPRVKLTILLCEGSIIELYCTDKVHGGL